ncbi:ABC transporter [Olsenella uli]|uniref:ABC transporter n=1 Tax=Olsenella uli TaxID=133926 RepID=UPI0024A8228A|nr:ABC transporter [Olsenella uli]
MAKELSAFLDESGGMGGTSKYRLVVLVLHEQDAPIADAIVRYETDLAAKGLPDVPFHAGPLMYGKDAYKDMPLAERRRLFASFSFFQRRLPFRYHVFAYRRSEWPDEARFQARLRRDLVVFLERHLPWLQSFDDVKLYYDGGQQTIRNAVHAALEYELSRQAVVYRSASPLEYRLSQVADYICTLELAALKFDAHEATATDEAFFGRSSVTFKRDYLKKLRMKLL